MRVTRRFGSWLPMVALLVALVLGAPTGRAGSAAVRGAVASEHPLVTRAAVDVLAQGGDAVDAAVTAALVAGVVAPTSSGLGGGGFALVLRPSEREPFVLDFREVAPRAVDAAALERRPLPFEERGHLVGVPGEARGLFELVRRFGKKPWQSLVTPAEQRARQGYAVGPHLARMLAGPSAAEPRRDAELASLFFPGGHAALEGRVLKNPKLASTLRRLGAEGAELLYGGSIAEEIVNTAHAAGSPMTREDLAGYTFRERKALHVAWAGHDIFTMPPPSAGGLLLAETLGMLSPSELTRLGFQSGAYQHLLAEAFRAALVDRFKMVGDPGFVALDVDRLLSEKRMTALRRALALDRTHSVPLLASEEHGTHHIVVVDGDGMVVSLTTTVNRVFGAKLVTPESGIVLNDQLDDFTLASDAARLGIAASPNAPRPLARPVSSMTPTIVLNDGKPVFAIGGSGGMTISTSVTQLLIARLLFGKRADELLAAPRIYVPPGGASTILLEEGAPQKLADDLVYRGERIATLPTGVSAVQLAALEGSNWEAAADPRKHGSAYPASSAAETADARVNGTLGRAARTPPHAAAH